MQDKWSNQITENSPYCIAHVRIITKKDNEPVDYTYVNVNKAYSTFIQLSHDQIVGKRALELSKRVTSGGFDWLSFLGRVALYKEFDETTQEISDDGKYIHIVAYRVGEKEVAFSFIDVSKEIDQLQLHEQLFNLTPTPVIVLSPEGIILRVNQEWQTLFDYLPQEMINRNMYDFIHPDDQSNVAACMSRIEKEGNTCSVATRIRSNDGSYKEIFWRAHHTHTYILAAGVDLSFIKKNERALQRQVDLQNMFMETTVSGFSQMMLDEPIDPLTITDSHLDIDEYLKSERIVSVNDAFANQYHTTKEILLGKTGYELYKDDLNSGRSNFIESVRLGKLSGEFHMKLVDGTTSWFYADITTLKDSKGRIVGHMILQIDINARKKVELELNRSETQFRLLSEYASDMIWSYNFHKGNFSYVSPAIINILGWTPDEVIQGDYTRYLYEEDLIKVKKQILLWAIEYRKSKCVNKKWILQLRHYTKKGTLVWIESAINFKEYPDSLIEVIGVSRDISDKKKAEADLVYSSYHDQLTKVFNRRYVNEQVELLIHQKAFPLSIITCDVNGLKLTNDVFGHSAGDALLRHTGSLLQSFAGKLDIVARDGGDEFLMLLPYTSREQAQKIMTKIKKESETIYVGKTYLSLSLGLSVMENEDDSYIDIYNQAENHLYRTKLIESYLYKQGLINILIHNLFEKHQEIKAHSEKVANLCQHIAKKLGLDEHDIEEIYVAGRLHDIGKIGLNEKLLHQSSEFNKEQLLSFQRHSELGFHLLKSVQYFGKIADWVLSHHEQPDGKGYPRGLKGYQIPIQSRIIHVANSFDLATLHLKEKNKETISLVLQLLDEKKGTMYDSRILEALQSLPLEVLMEDKIG